MTASVWSDKILLAQQHAQSGRFDEFLKDCQAIKEKHNDEPSAILSVGALLLNFGFLSFARECFSRVRIISPDDPRPLVNFANLACEAGDHAGSRRLYAALLEHLPDHPVIRRNLLVSLQYDPGVSDAERLAAARAWGDWATARAGGPHPRPPLRALDGRPLRVGYVSADFHQHTAGLFVKDVLAAHDPARVTAFAYSAGAGNDWVTAAVRAACAFRDVSALDDTALAARVRADGIDVLVDLSGHTGGSRLTAFAHRPAPVQVSWLGYFATTGLPAMDAVLMDPWHVPDGAEAAFTERVLRLPGGRFCYVPVPFAPEVAPPPSGAGVTFGCFNNTAKHNDGVFALWAEILRRVPDSRLVLKWRTFQDEGLRRSVLDRFAALGVEPARIELRGASFHADLLAEYGGIDVALDPFPFSGGLTSCEALWMGVPVVTWPRGGAVGRQTLAFLSAIGLAELAAAGPDDYVRIAVALAGDPDRRHALRRTLRERMRASPLMDARRLAGELEDAYHALCRGIGHSGIGGTVTIPQPPHG